MSDEEEVHSGEETRAPKEIKTGGLSEDDKLLLKENAEMRNELAKEIDSLRDQSKQRKKEREEYEHQMAERRAEEETRRKQEEDQRKQRRDEEEAKRRAARGHTMVTQFIPVEETEKKLIIQRSSGGGGGAAEEESGGGEKKSKEQLENEKKAILAQRIPAFDISGYDGSKLKEKCKELHSLIYRCESEKYDLEKRFKEQQYDMMELAERARQMNKVGKGGLKRIQLGPDEIDPTQTKFSGAPSRVEMFSKYERQKDKRSYGEKRDCYTGPNFRGPADRVGATRIVKWGEEGLPTYEDIPGAGGEEAAEGEEE